MSTSARIVVLKLETSEFKILTRSHTPGSPPVSFEELTNIALSLRERVGLGPHQRFRLVGVGLSNFREPGSQRECNGDKRCNAASCERAVWTGTHCTRRYEIDAKPLVRERQ